MNTKLLSAAIAIFASAMAMNANTYPLPDGMKIKATHPANDNGKLMTMEEAIYSSKTWPAKFSAAWYGENSYVYLKDGKQQLADAEKGIDINEDPILGAYTARAGKYLTKELPEGAANITPNPAANGFMSVMAGNRAIGTAPALAFTVGNSLYYIDQRKHICTIAESEGPGIVYGQTVSRNEFGISGGIFWSPDGKNIAFYRKD